MDTSYINVYTGFPFGMCVTSIPGVTQVDEKGHAGNTTVVVTDYVMLEEAWSKKPAPGSSQE